MRTSLGVALVCIACSSKPNETANRVASHEPPSSAAMTPQKLAGSMSFDRDLNRSRAAIQFHQDRVKAAPTSPTAYSRLASSFVVLGKLTGDYRFFDQAEEALERGFAVAKQKGSPGPLLERAALHFTLHRNGEALRDLDALERGLVRRSRPSTILGLRGSIAFHSGEYETAQTLLERSVEIEPTPQSLSRLALYHWKTGRFDEAERLYDEAESRYHGRAGEPRVFFDLVRGLMDLERGRLKDALAHYERGNERMPGYWLLEEHIAEAKSELGFIDEAERLYAGVVEKTTSPELMAAYAGVLDARGKDKLAAQWLERARAGFDAHLKQWPSAASGHALEFYLEHGPAERALELAQRNFELRPGGEAAVLLAKAHLAVDDVVAACAVLAKVEASPYRTAEFHAVAFEAYLRGGNRGRAEREKLKALSLNPTLTLAANLD